MWGLRAAFATVLIAVAALLLAAMPDAEGAVPAGEAATAAGAQSQSTTEPCSTCVWVGELSADITSDYHRERHTGNTDTVDIEHTDTVLTATGLVFVIDQDATPTPGVETYGLLSGTLDYNVTGTSFSQKNDTPPRNCTFEMIGTVDLQPGDAKLNITDGQQGRTYTIVGDSDTTMLTNHTVCDGVPETVESPLGQWFSSGDDPVAFAGGSVIEGSETVHIVTNDTSPPTTETSTFDGEYRWNLSNASLEVNSTEDVADPDIDDGACDVDLDAPELQCTLRAALQTAEATTSKDRIEFAIGAAGPASSGNVHTIVVGGTGLGPLPDITTPVTIDGTTQPGYNGKPLIEITGGAAGVEANGLNVTGTGGDVTIKGLNITGFALSGILLEGAGGNSVSENWLGLSPSGTEAKGNGTGLTIRSNNNTIGGTTQATLNYISGNRLKEDATKQYMAGLSGQDASVDQVLGAFATLGAGILVDQNSPTGNVIAGNNFGGGANNTPVGNTVGILLAPGTTPITNLTIGGALMSGGIPSNLFVRNTVAGVLAISAGGMNGLTVAGNGFGLSGVEGLGQNGVGIMLVGKANGVTIGGAGANEANAFARTGIGLALVGPDLDSVVVQKNLFGGASPALSNVFGILMFGADDVMVGGPGVGNGFLNNAIDVISAGTGPSANTFQANLFGDQGAGTGAIGLMLVGGFADKVLDNKFDARALPLLIAGGQADTITGNTISGGVIGAWLHASGSNDFGGSGQGQGNVITKNEVGMMITNDEPTDDELERAGALSGFVGQQQILQTLEHTEVADMLNVINAVSPQDIDDAVATAFSGEGVGPASVSVQGEVSAAADAFGNKLQGNYFGTNAAGATGLGNGFGLMVLGAVDSTLIGGSEAGQGNTFANSIYAGLWIGPSNEHPGRAPDDAAVIGSSFYNNGGHGLPLLPGTPALGLDLIAPNAEFLVRAFGPTANDGLDADSGANGLQNYPTLLSATTEGAGTRVRGRLHSTPGQSFLLEFFRSEACHANGYGEGKTLLGRLDVTTDAAGNALFNNVFVGALSVGTPITATATVAGLSGPGSTSEFSRCRNVGTETALANPADEGALELALDDTTGVQPGTQLMLNPGGPTEEVVTVAGAAAAIVPAGSSGSLSLESPLAFAHTAGETVIIVDLPVTETLWGNADCSGGVDGHDLLTLLGAPGGITVLSENSCPYPGEKVFVPGPATWGDLDCDSTVTTTDALALLRWLAGLEPETSDVCPEFDDPVTVIEVS